MKIYPGDWKIRLTGAVGGMVGAAVGLFVVKPLIDLPPVLGPLAYIALVGVGVILGNLGGSQLFRPSSGGPSDESRPVG